MKKTIACLTFLSLTGCGVQPTALAPTRLAAETGALAKGADLARAFVAAESAKYGPLFTPDGASVTATKVETYKIQGGTTRVRATLVIKAEGFEAQLFAMAALKGDKPVADYVPTFSSATVRSTARDVDAACTYAARLQRLSTAALDAKIDLDDHVSPKKYEIKVHQRANGEKMLAEVSYKSEGFMGKGSTFTESYYVYGKRGKETTITSVSYGDNKATDANGNDLDG
ncbi:MAG: hypothetical protein JWM80_6512 [Cyanobacteria bacterium RYN_339]|nr:hypothetical protein [Cyanobacteria bacterium RYN_339]